MKDVTINICGHEFYLLYNGAAMYALRDKLGDQKIYEVIVQDDFESFGMLCEILAELIAQGELFRRWNGYDKGKIVTAATLRVILRPADLHSARQAVMDAFTSGMRNEVPEDEDIDLGLQEIEAQKSKKKVSRKRNT